MSAAPLRPGFRGAGLDQPEWRDHSLLDQVRSAGPGLVVAAVAAGLASGLGWWLDGVSPLTTCLVLGILEGYVRPLTRGSLVGMRIARGPLLRLGVALLGFRLALGSVTAVGLLPLLAVTVVAAVTFLGVAGVARRLGLSAGLGALVGAGFAICGASAVAAAAGLVDAEEEDVAFAAGLATLFGTISLFLVPWLATMLGLAPEALGFWAGASVNDVGQAVATASQGGAAALQVGVVAKLARVLLLAPLLVLLGTAARRRVTGTQGVRSRPALLPWFVVAFLGAATVRSTGVLPDGLLEGIQLAEVTLIGVGLVGVGAGVDLRAAQRAGARPVALGAIAWLIVLSAGLLATAVVVGG